MLIGKKNGFFIYIFLLNVFYGCAPTITTSVLQPPCERSADTLRKPEPVIEENIVDTPSTVILQIDSCLELAQNFCEQGLFQEANRVLIDATVIMESANGSLDDIGSDNLSRLLLRIAELYHTALPKEYLDSIPVSISSVIFRYQMCNAIDTLLLAPNDSILYSIVKCEEGLPYNIPFVHNARVQNSLYYIVTARKNTMELLLTRANYYLPFMQRMFADNNLPTDLAYLPILESGFNSKAYSYAHASGIWQFIPSTGRIYGLRQSYWLDERRDPIKSTSAAIRYLKKLHTDFNDWYLALAAYNCGERNVSRSIEKAAISDFWQLSLPKQTMQYVPLFVAYQIVGKNPQCFGFDVEQTDTFDFDTVHISECIDLHKIAEKMSIGYSELKAMNPHIREWCTPPDIKDVTLYLPVGTSDTFRIVYQSFSDDEKVRWYRYRIKNGDNLLGIAQRFKTSVAGIQSINKLRGNFIVAGRYLYIPVPANREYPSIPEQPVSCSVKSGNPVASTTLSEIDSFQKKGLKPLKYRIGNGETISDVSKLFNIKVEAICRWNNISNTRLLQSGTILTLYVEESSKQTISIKKPSIQSTPDLPKSFYIVKSGDNLYSISHLLGLSLEQLAIWNNKDLENPSIMPGEELVYYISANAQPAQPGPSVQKRTDSGVRHEVKKGDTFYSLAQLYGVSVEQVLSANSLTPDTVIKPKDILLIPAERHIPKNNNPKNNEQGDERIVYYKVQNGDNLWSIASLFSVTIDSLFRANNLTKNSVIKPGDTIRIVLREGS